MKNISPAEAEVIRLKMEGLLNKEIADRLNRSHATITTHLQHCREKLGAHNSIEMINAYNNLKNQNQ